MRLTGSRPLPEHVPAQLRGRLHADAATHPKISMAAVMVGMTSHVSAQFVKSFAHRAKHPGIQHPLHVCPAGAAGKTKEAAKDASGDAKVSMHDLGCSLSFSL